MRARDARSSSTVYPQLRVQALALEGERRGVGHGADQLGLLQQTGIVDERAHAATLQLHRGGRAARFELLGKIVAGGVH